MKVPASTEQNVAAAIIHGVASDGLPPNFCHINAPTVNTIKYIIRAITTAPTQRKIRLTLTIDAPAVLLCSNSHTVRADTKINQWLPSVKTAQRRSRLPPLIAPEPTSLPWLPELRARRVRPAGRGFVPVADAHFVELGLVRARAQPCRLLKPTLHLLLLLPHHRPAPRTRRLARAGDGHAHLSGLDQIAGLVRRRAFFAVDRHFVIA
jgi:hypothetical protein